MNSNNKLYLKRESNANGIDENKKEKLSKYTKNCTLNNETSKYGNVKEKRGLS